MCEIVGCIGKRNAKSLIDQVFNLADFDFFWGAGQDKNFKIRRYF